MNGGAVDRLRAYFDFLQAQAEQTGYPKTAAFAREFETGTFGSRILTLDMHPSIRKTRKALMQLDLRDREVLTLKYGHDRHPNGKPVTDAQRADIAGCSLGAFRKRRIRALRRFAQK